MANTDESNREQKDIVQKLTKEPKPRFAVDIAALIHNENHFEHMKQYYGLLMYEEPLVGWIIAETPRAMDGGEYMVLLIYKKEINMVMIDHVLGNQIIDTIQAAGTVDMIDKENDYGDRVYETVHQLGSKALVLLGLCNIVEHQAMRVPKGMADLFETFRVHGGHLWTMLPTMTTERIYKVSFRFEQDQPKESLRLNTEQVADGTLAIEPTDCPNTIHISSPRNRRTEKH